MMLDVDVAGIDVEAGDAKLRSSVRIPEIYTRPQVQIHHH